MRLITLILKINRLSGPFPTTLTSITSLQYLNIHGNDFSGLIPEQIAALTNLESLYLSSNDFTGKLSFALANLTNLKELVISDNNFTGKIPNFISRWRQIQTLEVQGSSLEGPIPSSISLLTQLNNLYDFFHLGVFSIGWVVVWGGGGGVEVAILILVYRKISDLKVEASKFPSVEKMTNLHILVLRNCLIHGSIPNNIGNLIHLVVL
ncbi:putative non-specific serine/threonine protein kinase [Helianthus annuus]|nr:putative non-specific serine/threonine protein kinase [Helianthus annuus]